MNPCYDPAKHDIVTRLRECLVTEHDEYTWWQTMEQAANEIERLQIEIRHLNSLIVVSKEEK